MSATAANGAHLLVVDDDQDLLRLLTMRLHAWGYRVSTASSAEEGLARIAVEPPRSPAQMERAVKGLVDGRYQWVVFTSTNAVRAAASTSWPPWWPRWRRRVTRCLRSGPSRWR